MWRTALAAGIGWLLLQAVPGVSQSEETSPFEEVLHSAAELGIVRHADLPYDAMAGVDPARLSLDVWSRPGLVRAPVVLFVHGGSWQRGDKKAVLRKPLALVPAGYVVLSIHYRFRPEATVAEQARDVARAVAWAHEYAGHYGGDPDRLFLMGHSAGAHLVSVVGTNGAFLEAQGLSLADLAGVVSLDTGPYDVALQMERTAAESSYGKLMRSVFGDDPAGWDEVSPVRHVGPGRHIPPFLVFASDGRADVPYQARPFVEALRRAGVEADLVEATGKTHGSLNADLGLPGDATTERLLAFLREHGGVAGSREASAADPFDG